MRMENQYSEYPCSPVVLCVERGGDSKIKVQMKNLKQEVTDGYISCLTMTFGERAARAAISLVMQLERAELCFPELLNSSCRKPEPPHSGTVLFHTVMSLTSLLTVALNLLVIISISHFRQLHTPTNILLLSLAVSDFIVGLLAIPLEILLSNTCWVLGDLACVLYYLIPITTITASVTNMVFISVDRYVVICDPLHYPTKFTQKRVIICVLLGWICSLFYGIFLLYDNLKHPGRYNSCNGECVVQITGAIDLAVAFIFPITVIIVLNMRVFIVAMSQSKDMRSHIAAVSLKRSMTMKVEKSEIKAARTLGVLIAVFLMCYSPYYCVSLSGYSVLIGSETETYMIFLMYFNSCINPIIYVLFYPWFKKTIRLIVTFQILQPGSHHFKIL